MSRRGSSIILRRMGRWIMIAVLASVFTLGALSMPRPPLFANPFEAIARDHWAYLTVRRLSGHQLGKPYVEERVRLGEPITHFDLALWVGDTFDSLRAHAVLERGDGTAGTLLRLDELAESYNARHGAVILDAPMIRTLAEMTALVRGHLEVLGYVLPPDLRGERHASNLQGMTQVLEDFRLRGESNLRFTGVHGSVPQNQLGDLGHGGSLQQRYRLELSGPVSDSVRIGAEIEGGSQLWFDQSDGLELRSAGLDVGLSHAGVARIGQVSGRGLSELAIAETDGLSGLQAGLQTGQLGSTLLVASYGAAASDPGGASAASGTVAAWDGSVRVNERLQLGATLAHQGNLRVDDNSEEENTVIRLGGTYSVSPQLILSGEMAQSTRESGAGGSAIKVGAVLHPLPELTLGAFLFTSGSGYSALFSTQADPVARLDLSAEVGRWILSLRRQNVYRLSDAESVDPATMTRLSVAYPLSEMAIARASHERGDSGGSPSPIDVLTTALDLEVHFDQGKVSLGYVLEGAGGGTGMGSGTAVRSTTRASVEHAVGPIGTAIAGFSFVDQGAETRTSSNVGLKYDFDNASVSLQYEIFNETGDRGNVTTAEVSIKF